ncbi:MAG: response regulator transcription factor [Armatimonadota bacterium]|nr:response regulator transcription factor [Armatimonadota bacterium]
MDRDNGLTRLLLIEDDALLADALRAKLENSGYEVRHASTGEDGLTSANSRDFDVVLLDLMLPDMQGDVILDEIRATSTVPVVVISAKDTEPDQIRNLRRGADDYITKPFSPRELVARLEALLRRSGTRSVVHAEDRDLPDHAAIAAGDVEIDLNSRRTLVDGQPVHLTPTEFRLLRCLMEHQGKPVSYQYLLGRVWGFRGYDSSVVKTNVHRLREKIEDDTSHPTRILTVNGIGYRFVAKIAVSQ